MGVLGGPEGVVVGSGVGAAVGDADGSVAVGRVVRAGRARVGGGPHGTHRTSGAGRAGSGGGIRAGRGTTTVGDGTGWGEMTTVSPAMRSARLSASGRPAATVAQKIATQPTVVVLSTPPPKIPAAV